MSGTPDQDRKLARYAPQMRFEPLGERGQKALLRSSTTLIGCGALGTVLANTLVRAGVGQLRVVDRDFIEIDNLQRQVLFDEQDIAENLPKAEAAARKLRRINSAVEIEAVVADANPGNIESLCRDADLLLDGTDNFETRFLINDVAVKQGLPWVYGACVASEGLVMAILPGDTPCLRCVWEAAPPPGMTPTCDTAGVLGPIVEIVASLQALEAMKILSGRYEALHRKLLSVDGWAGRFRSLDMQRALDDGDCACCKHRRFDYLEGSAGSNTTSLCGRDAVQVLPPQGLQVDFSTLADRLRSHRPRQSRFMLRFEVDGRRITVFPDGRAIVQGTQDPTIARSLYARFIGS